VLYSFTGGADGANPTVGLLLDSTGSLYTPASLGANSVCFFNFDGAMGSGSVVKVTPSLGTKWTASAENGELLCEFGVISTSEPIRQLGFEFREIRCSEIFGGGQSWAGILIF
jgi:hypothetical protein